MTTMYGIANCDTIKKAKRWLDENNIEYSFHDYKKLNAPEEMLRAAIDEFGLDVIVNKRGTTYRKLDEHTKASLDLSNVIALLIDNSSMIKRPILAHNKKLLVGFNEQQYQEFFNIA